MRARVNYHKHQEKRTNINFVKKFMNEEKYNLEGIRIEKRQRGNKKKVNA